MSAVTGTPDIDPRRLTSPHMIPHKTLGRIGLDLSYSFIADVD